MVWAVMTRSALGLRREGSAERSAGAQADGDAVDPFGHLHKSLFFSIPHQEIEYIALWVVMNCWFIHGATSLLKEMLCLALGFALLCTQPLEFADGSLKHESAKGTKCTKPFRVLRVFS